MIMTRRAILERKDRKKSTKTAGEDVEMVEAEGGKVAGEKRAREDKGKGKAVEEAESEEEQRRKKQRGDRLREIHKGMKTSVLHELRFIQKH